MTATTDRDYLDAASTSDAGTFQGGSVIEVVNSFFPEPLIVDESDDQDWVHTPFWQESLRRSIAQIDAGEGIKFTTAEQFLSELDED